MEIKIQIKSILGDVLFEFSKEGNSIKKTIEAAVQQGADLRGAYLGGADLGGAGLGGADLRGADLRGAYLGDADLRGADLRGAYLGGANLEGANLRGAYLRGAYLGGANLEGAYLGGANLEGANLRGAGLRGAGKISSVDDILIVGPMGSRAGYTQAYHTDKGIFVKCGCFFGTITQFRAKVKETHGDNRHAQDYALLADFIEARFNTK